MASPSLLASHPNGRWLYAASEAGQGGPDNFGGVWALRYTRDPVTFEPINSQDARGTAPCHLALDHTARWLVFANYGTGSAGVMPVRADGSLGPMSRLRPAPGPQCQPRPPGASRTPTRPPSRPTTAMSSSATWASTA